jgi:selenocysteine lyase/cysteine desulfurase
MEKFEGYAFGAHPDAHYYGLEKSIDFLDAIGIDRIQMRLFALSKRWTDRAARLDGIRIAVRVEPEHCSGLIGWEWAGRPADSVAARMREAMVYSGGTEQYGGVFGIPQTAPRWLFCTNTAVFTSLADVDRLADTIEAIARA